MINEEKFIYRLKRNHPDIYEQMSEYEYAGYGEWIIKRSLGYYLYFPINDDLASMPGDIPYNYEPICQRLFTRRLKNMLLYLNITQSELSYRTGLSRRTISNYLTGNRMPNFFALEKIAYALDCDISDLTYKPSI